MREGLKLLMAEDNEINRKLADLLFKRQGLALDFANNGAEAVDMAVENTYQIVFMDIEMPVMGGLEATAKIQESMGDQAPAIVALTAHAMEGDRERFIEAGMSDYLTKPIDVAALNTLIEKYSS